MAVLAAFAFLSGIVTVLSPCILPVLPIVLSGGVGAGKARPLGVLAGFVASFTGFTLALSALVRLLAIPADALRIAAVVVVAALGLVMLVPALSGLFEKAAARIASLAAGRSAAARSAAAGRPRSGFVSGLAVGVSLGLVWTPCVGPIMASVVSLALTERVDGGAVAITLAYTLGTSIPMLAVMLGGRALLARVPALARNASRIQRGFGVVMVLVAVAIGLGWDRKFQAAVLRAFPGYGAGLTALEEAGPVREALERRAERGGPVPAARGDGRGTLGDWGPAPGLVAEGPWLNLGAPAPTMESLRGKVVIVDFWTYSCVNCVRTIPHLRRLYDTYRGLGLELIGVHTPEFAFERSTANVARAIADLGVTWPVVQDNDYAQWTAYANRYWPAHFIIDARGTLRASIFGEGREEETETVVRRLLQEAGVEPGPRITRPGPAPAARTPETYLGTARAAPAARRASSARLAPGQWTLEGTWAADAEYVESPGTGSLTFAFDARDVFLVIEPLEEGAVLEVRVDGRAPADTADVRSGTLSASGSRMYHLVSLRRPGRHLLRLEMRGRARLFAFTFG